MTEALSQAALAISGVLFAGLWEGAILFAAVWLCLRAFSSLGASTRYAIWLCTLVMLVVAPVCTIALSGQHGPSTAVAPLNAVSITDSNASENAQAIPLKSGRRYQTSVLANASSPRGQIDIPSGLSLAIAALWLLATATRAVVLAVNLRGLAMLRKSAEIIREAYGYTVLSSQRASVPLAIGFTHPAVVLPASLNAELSSEAVDAIVMHEVAHLRRYDVWTNALARVFEAFLALNPFAWMVLARLSAEREIACDDWVVMRLDAGEVFAKALAKMACRPVFASIAAPSALGSKHTVVTRIERLLDKRPRRLRLSAVALTGILIVLTVFATMVPTVSPVLAFAPSAAGCGDHPVLMQQLLMNGRPNGRWAALRYDPVKAHDPKSTVVDLTIDARGNLRNIAVISSPHARDARATKWYFAQGHYRPAIVNCKAVASTARLAVVIDIAPPAPISIVRATYPQGWSSAHSGACRVPDLLHGGVPDVRLVNSKTLTTSVRVQVDMSGRVANATLTQSSGNAAYDNATLAAARGNMYPLNESTGFKPVRPSGASLSWNATHGYSLYSKCTPPPGEYTWTTTFPPADR